MCKNVKMEIFKIEYWQIKKVEIKKEKKRFCRFIVLVEDVLVTGTGLDVALGISGMAGIC